MKDTTKDIIKEFCNAFGLGSITEEIQSVSGGLLHAMYRVETSTGVYAVKVLNPEIMQRPEALQNMINSEKVAHALEPVVPLAAAKEFEENHVVQYENTWFMVFDWLEGVSVFAQEITPEHCREIGELLGKIHAADVKVEGMESSEEVRDVFAWENEEHSRLDAEVVQALKKLSSHKVISHRDLDPKNVMWQNNTPYIIDWEASGYVNPYQELAEVLNYWITDADGGYNFEKFLALMKAYTAFMSVRGVDWETVLLCSFDGILGWLEYNIRRAAGLLGNGEEDCQEGRKQVEATIGEIKRQQAQAGQLKQWLNDWK